MIDYDEFLERKLLNVENVGFDAVGIRELLFGVQVDGVRWAAKRGRAAIFYDTGLGKTIMELELARLIHDETGNRVMILTPLAVAQQTEAKAIEFGYDARYTVSQEDVSSSIVITNYEKLHRFDASQFDVLLDESSILKSLDGKTKTRLIETFARTPYRYCFTATPAPNDHMELGNTCEFLGIMTREEMLAMFFVHDGGSTSQWRLKGHAEKVFWKWVATWAVMVKHPRDLGYEDARYDLPPLEFHTEIIESQPEEAFVNGVLFTDMARTLNGQRAAKKKTMAERIELCQRMINDSREQWLIWCELNDEGDRLEREIIGAVQVAGRHTEEEKIDRMMGFTSGKYRVLITKPKIAGFGMNWQHCHNIAFIGVTHSYEQFYQCIRRCWRFGQQKPVHVWMFAGDEEMAVVMNLQRKQEEADKMSEEMLQHAGSIQSAGTVSASKEVAAYQRDIAETEHSIFHLGDCIEVSREIPSDSIHYSIFSPPFASLYTYSNSERDMGNSTSGEEFFQHFQFLVDELYRITMPGRLVSFHCMNIPATITHDGYIGIKDFRGDLIRMFIDDEAAEMHAAIQRLQARQIHARDVEDNPRRFISLGVAINTILEDLQNHPGKGGFIYHSEVCIWKDPVTAMQRTKALGLLHKQTKKDTCMSRQGIADYLVTMRKPGENPERVTKTNESFPVEVWQRYASPVWMDIDPGDTLQYRAARDSSDERHICPLQLGVIRRGVQLWTNPGDVVFSPFGGIASEGYVALEMGRRFLGVELKKSYWEQGTRNLRAAEQKGNALELLPANEDESINEIEAE